MRNLNFMSMRGTDLCGDIVDQKRVPGRGILYIVQKCGRIHAVLNGMTVADTCDVGDVRGLIKRAEGEI